MRPRNLCEQAMERRRTILIGTAAFLAAGTCYPICVRVQRVRLDNVLVAPVLGNNESEVVRCLRLGADPDSRRASGAAAKRFADMFRPDEPGSAAPQTALQLAMSEAENGSGVGKPAANRRIVLALISAGARTSVVDERGRTPLMLSDDVAVTDALLLRGAEPNSKDEAGRTPLIAAAQARPDWYCGCDTIPRRRS
jgi:hypothetical protein